ncbi:MAG TPA: fibronectin type III domain-containing protein [Polyangiaceae bacterium]|nr:fibronectin type III domain-containing protein [Polyangiaceae bacterium]
MPRFPRWVVFCACACAPAIASAQTTTTTSGATITASGQVNPERFITPMGAAPGSAQVDVGQSTRSQNQNPLGVNFQDCENDMTLSFPIVVSGFSGQNLQVWASQTGTCTDAGARGQGQTSTCWIVYNGSQAINMQASQAVNIPIRVRDLVGPVGSVGSTNPVYKAYGEEACHSQTSFPAVSLTIYFLPILNATVSGTSYSYPISTDLVGPAAPNGVSIKDGDTLFVVNWTPNTDTDTAGYDIFIDPVPGQEGNAVTTRTVCPEASTPTPAVDASVVDSGDDGSIDAMTATVDAMTGDATTADGATADDASADGATAGAPIGDAACYPINVATPGATSTTGSGSQCPSTALAGGFTVDGGETTILDDAGDAAVVSGSGGISTGTILNYIYKADPATGSTVSGLTNQTYTIEGLLNGRTYTVAVAAVDGSGNVGPPSLQQCDYPAPVDDFWKIYRRDGGGAGGGLCALEAVGSRGGSTLTYLSVGAAAVAFGRRRKRKR